MSIRRTTFTLTDNRVNLWNMQAQTEILTEINRKLRVVVCLPVRNQVDLVLSPLLLEALLRAPVLANAAAYQDNDERPHQPEPCKSTPINTHPAALM